jgi:hypothetical protein
MDLNAPISTMFTSTTTSGDISSTTTTANYAGYYWPLWEPYQNYYIGYYHSPVTADKFEIAFKLARKLMEKKIVKHLKTIEDFFKLMDTIVEVL